MAQQTQAQYSSQTTSKSQTSQASSYASVNLTNAQIQYAVNYNRKTNQSICKDIQRLVNVTVDGSFGPQTVKGIATWQANNGLEADGCFGPKSKAKANLGGSKPQQPAPQPQQPAPKPTTNLLTSTQVNSAVKYNKANNQSRCREIQKLVNTEVDGSFGPNTVQAIARWQSSNGLEVDGKFGPACRAKAGMDGSAKPADPKPADPKPAEPKPEEPKDPGDTTPISMGPDDYTGRDTVKYGANNNKVRTMQKLLNHHNAGRHGAKLGVDGSFGKGTATALMRFQYFYVKSSTEVCGFFKNNGVAICDAATWDKLRMTSPSYTNEKGKPIAFNRSGQPCAYTPVDIHNVNGKKIGKLSSDAAPNFDKMAKASKAEGNGQGITGIASSFRGMTDEATVAVTGGVGGNEGAIELYVDRGFSPNDAAHPGYSYHCRGNAIDINNIGKQGTGPLWQWLKKNAANYGFKGFDHEHWHWYY